MKNTLLVLSLGLCTFLALWFWLNPPQKRRILILLRLPGKKGFQWQTISQFSRPIPEGFERINLWPAELYDAMAIPKLKTNKF